MQLWCSCFSSFLPYPQILHLDEKIKPLSYPKDATTLNITTFSITTLIIKGSHVILSINDSQCNNTLSLCCHYAVIMLSLCCHYAAIMLPLCCHYAVIMLSLCGVSHFIYYYAECHYAECGHDECHVAQCRYVECRLSL